MSSAYDVARAEGYSDEEIKDFMGKRLNKSPQLLQQKQQQQAPTQEDRYKQALDAGYSKEEVDKYLHSKKPGFQRFMEASNTISTGGAKEAALYGAGRVIGSAPAIAWDTGAAHLANEDSQLIEYRKHVFEDIERLAEQKQTGVWDEDDQKLMDSLIEQVKTPQGKEEFGEKARPFVKTADITTMGLLEKSGLKPEGLIEKGALWTGILKNPANLRELTKAGLKPQDLKQALIPTAKEIGSGYGAAAAMEMAEAGELGPIGSLAALVVGSIIGKKAPGALKQVGKFAKSPIQSSKAIAGKTVGGLTRLFSNSEKLKLQQDLIKQFRDAGIQADLGSITGNNLVKMVQARLAQSGLVGSALDDFRANLTKQIVGEYGKLAQGLGEAQFATLHDAGVALKEGIQSAREVDLAEVRGLYKGVREGAKGKFAVVETPAIAENLRALETELTPGSLKSPETKKVLDAIDSLKKDIYDPSGELKPISLDALLNNKINLADMIDYDVQGGAKQLLKKIVGDLDDAIKKYGKTDVKLGEAYAKANAKFGQHADIFRNKNISNILRGEDPATLMNKFNSVQGIQQIKAALGKSHEGKKLFNELKRAKFEDVVMKNMIDGATNQLKMGKFSNILEKGKNRSVVKELLGSENFARLERLQNATGKLAASADKFFNASKSGSTMIDTGIVSSGLTQLGFLLTGNPWPFAITAGGFVAARSLAKMITDPVFLKEVEDGILAAGKKDMKAAGRNFDSAMFPLAQEEIYSQIGMGEEGGIKAAQEGIKARGAEGKPRLNRKKESALSNRIFEQNPRYQPPDSVRNFKDAGLHEEAANPSLYRRQEYGPFRQGDELGKTKPLTIKQEKFYRREWNKYFPPELFNKVYRNLKPPIDQATLGEVVGNLGDFVQGKYSRELLKDVLDIPVRVNHNVAPPRGGFYNDIRKDITLTSKLKPSDLLMALFHEGWHGVQDFHGVLKKYPWPKPLLPKYMRQAKHDLPFPETSQHGYLQEPWEQEAREFERWMTKDLQDYRKSVMKTKSLRSMIDLHKRPRLSKLKKHEKGKDLERLANWEAYEDARQQRYQNPYGVYEP